MYSEFQCIDLMSSAARANDVPFIDTMWQRLSDDLQRDRSGNSKVAPGSRIDANSDIVRAISGDAAAPVDGLDAPMEPKPKPPSAHAHTEVIRAYVMCEAYGKAFELLHSLEQLYPGDAACSVYSGVRFFPESLNTEAKIGAAFEQLQQRQVRCVVHRVLCVVHRTAALPRGWALDGVVGAAARHRVTQPHNTHTHTSHDDCAAQ